MVFDDAAGVQEPPLATLSILNAVFSPKERPQAIAAWSAVAGVSIIVGPTLGGLLLTHFWWGSVFLINVPLVPLAIAGVILTVPETAEPGGHRLDLLGTLLVAVSLVAIVDAIIEAPARGWTAGMTLAEAAAGLGALAIFVRWELRTAHPLIDLRIFASRAFSAAAASVTVIFFALFGSLFVLTQYLQLVHGYSPLSAGVRALPFALAMGAVSPVSPVLARRLGTRVIIPAGMTLMGLGLLDLSTAGVHTSYPALALAVATMGAGMGLVMAPASTTIMATVPGRQASAGSAVNDTIREAGGALGIAIIGSLSAAAYRSRLASALATAHVPGSAAHVATGSIAAAGILSRRVGGPEGTELARTARSAFVTAMDMGMRVKSSWPARLRRGTGGGRDPRDRRGHLATRANRRQQGRRLVRPASGTRRGHEQQPGHTKTKRDDMNPHPDSLQTPHRQIHPSKRGQPCASR